MHRLWLLPRIVVWICSWCSGLGRVYLVVGGCVLSQDLVVYLFLVSLSLLEFVLAPILLGVSIVALLTSVWPVCLVVAAAVLKRLLILHRAQLCLWILRLNVFVSIFTSIVWTALLTDIVFEIPWNSVNRSVLIGSISHWRIILNHIRFHLVPGKLFSQGWICYPFGCRSTIGCKPSLLWISKISSRLSRLQSWSFWSNKNVPNQPFILLFQV